MHFRYSGGDLIWKGSTNNKTVSIQVVFFYDKYLVETVHLLEHLLLNPGRFGKGESSLHVDFVEEADLVNGYTSGIFLTLKVVCHIDDAFKYWEKIKKVIVSDFNPTLDQIEHEMNIIEHEHQYLDKDLFTTGFTYKLWDMDPSFSSNVVTVDTVKQCFADVVLNNSCLVLLRGNWESSKIIDLKEDIELFLSTRRTHYPQYSLKTFKYKPVRDDLKKFEHPKAVSGVVYSATRGHLSEVEYLMHVFTALMVKKYLFHYLRYIKGSGYDITMNYRNTPYGWEQYCEFLQDGKPENIITLLEKLPEVVYEKFEQYKKMIVKDMIISILTEPHFNSYYTIQLFYFSKKYYTVEEMEQIMMSFTKEQFISFFHVWIERTSYVANIDYDISFD